jgi:hypothetical protein
MIESHAVGDPSTPIMTDNRKRFESKFAHCFNLIGSHNAFRIRAMILVRLRLATVATTAQITTHDGEAPSQLRSYAMPTNMSFRIAVEKKNRRAITGDHAIDLGPGCRDHPLIETLEHVLILQV